MEKLTQKALAMQVAVTAFVAGLGDRRDERGQGSVEYVGIIIAVVALLGLIIAAFSATDIGNTLVERIEEEIGNL